MLQHQAKTLAI